MERTRPVPERRIVDGVGPSWVICTGPIFDCLVQVFASMQNREQLILRQIEISFFQTSGGRFIELTDFEVDFNRDSTGVISGKILEDLGSARGWCTSMTQMFDQLNP